MEKPAKRNHPGLAKGSGVPLTFYNKRFLEDINVLAQAGFVAERTGEKNRPKTLNSDDTFQLQYYSAYKAQKFPQFIVLKARKL